MRMSGGSSGLRFHHCTFDGGLAPWTTRTDVKDGVGSETGDSPGQAHAGRQPERIRELHLPARPRRAPDARGPDRDARLAVRGHQRRGVPVRGRGSSNVRIHGNVVRQALMSTASHLDPSAGRSTSIATSSTSACPRAATAMLPPDAPAPFGLALRLGLQGRRPRLPFHVLPEHVPGLARHDKASYVSQIFYTDPPRRPAFLNNLHLVLNLDRPLSRVPSLEPRRASRRQRLVSITRTPSPLFPRPLWVSGSGKYFTLDELWAASRTGRPTANTPIPSSRTSPTNISNTRCDPPNTDYRPRGRRSRGRRRRRPAPDLPDDFSPGAAMPDVGARPVERPGDGGGVDAATRSRPPACRWRWPGPTRRSWMRTATASSWSPSMLRPATTTTAPSAGTCGRWAAKP